MSDYKFVTREEIGEFSNPTGPISWPNVLKTIERLLAERDAYREVAINASCQSDFDCCAKEHGEEVDFEAARILGDKK